MKIDVPEIIKELAEKADFPLYVVGGFVRNSLAGIAPSDIDICGPEVLSENSLPEGFYIVSTYKRMGTALIKSVRDPSLEIEYTAFRKESYTEGGAHTPEIVSFGATIEEDALRRDFTANSIYYDVKREEIIDPLGGIVDVKKKLLRAFRPSDVFSSDGLRLMRLARIAAETGFSIEAKTAKTAYEKSFLLKDITKNRIYGELERILAADTKYGIPDAHYRGLELLKELNLLEYVIPELKEMDGMKQNPVYHRYDVLEHTFRTVLSAPPKIRLAALLHDIGKPQASHCQEGKLFSHEVFGAEITARLLGPECFALPKKEAEKTVRLVRWHMYDKDRKTKDGKIKLFVADNADILDELCALLDADEAAHGTGDPRPNRLKEVYGELVKTGAPVTLQELKVNGNDLINLGYKGTIIKKELKALRRECILNPALNKRTRLLKQAKEDMGLYG